MNRDKFIGLLRVHIAKKHKTNKRAAEVWDISTSKLCRILSEELYPTDTILAEMGLAQTKNIVLTYDKVKK